jgi:MoaA/NifB/PqqE/SkfB family radical SAM enzyme
MKDNPPVMYEPWSSKVIERSIDKFANGYLPTLNIELSAKCNHKSCIYCDTQVGFSNQNELSFDQLRSVVDEAKGIGIEWVYICGLGEPTNDEKFFKLIEYLHEKNIKISIFSNGIGYTKDEIKKLKHNEVNLVLKLDSFNEQIFDSLLGKQGSAKCIYKTLALLLEVGYAERNENNLTDLAFSIVPTKINLHDIPNIIEYCKQNNIFPSVGELECSGKAKESFYKLSPSREELINLKIKIDNILDYNYKKPICPSAITGLHITNLGRYVIDEKTGLSCSWYSLKEPTYLEIGRAGDDMKLVLDRMIKYRMKKWDDMGDLIKNHPPHIFGGCGGDIKTLLHLSIKAARG